MEYGKTGQESTHLVHKFLVNGKPEIAYTLDSFPVECLFSLPTVRRHNITYYNVPAAFDIETTNVIDADRPYAFMYHWQFCIGETVIFGRTWEQYILFINKIAEYLELGENRMLAVYVHNLPFEFQFLYSRFDFDYIFARKERKPIIARTGGIEYRCSYFLSNMSLFKLCQNSPGVQHYKQGNYNYHIYRTSETPMKPHELAYYYCDVRGLCECIEHRLEEDTIASIPMTSTGYVRRDIRKLFQQDRKWKTQQKTLALEAELYIMMREAFRGGDTHANATYSALKLEEVYSADETSSYPGAMMIDKFPMSPFLPCHPKRINRAIKDGYAVIFRVHLHNVKLKSEFGIPYIDLAHTRHRKKYRVDNGRILEAEDIEITITDLDWRIICHDYDIESVNVGCAYMSKYDYLPEPLRKGVMEYFYQKCTLKGIAEKEYEYMKSKNRINGIYGMTVTDVVQEIVEFLGHIEDSKLWKSTKITDMDKIQEGLDTYYNSRSSFLSYQHGVWVTANARMRLREGIWVMGDDIVYVDTDSLKFLDSANLEKIEQLNALVMGKVDNAPIRPEVIYNGKTHIMPLWEIENHGKPFRFKTLGAKKYIIQEKDARPVITIAGVDKKAGSAEIYYKSRHYKKDPLDMFHIGMVFEAAHHSTAYYNDGADSNVAIVNGNYTLGVTDTYEEIIYENLKKSVDKK